MNKTLKLVLIIATVVAVPGGIAFGIVYWGANAKTKRDAKKKAAKKEAGKEGAANKAIDPVKAAERGFGPNVRKKIKREK